MEAYRGGAWGLLIEGTPRTTTPMLPDGGHPAVQLTRSTARERVPSPARWRAHSNYPTISLTLFKIEEQGLPPSFEYVNARLTGQPLIAILWVLLMTALYSLVFVLDPHRGRVGNAIVVCFAIYFGVVLAGLLSVATRADGRRWLLRRSVEPDRPVTTMSRIVIRLLPLLALAVVLEYSVVHHY